MLYFDNNACVPMTKKILSEYCSGAALGNISNDSSHEGRSIKMQLDSLLNFLYPLGTIIYTSGGSESNSTVINMFKDGHIVCPMSEHSSVIGSLQGCDVSWVKPKATGHINIGELLGVTKSNTKLIILQSINSETGAIQDLKGLIANNRQKIHIHCDNVQGFIKRHDMKEIIMQCKQVGQPISIAVSFHKIGAPIGFGALFTNTRITPLIGGKQNSGLRGGTYNIGAMKATIQAIKDYNYGKIVQLRQLFDTLIVKHFIVINYSDLQRMIDDGAKLSSTGYIVMFSCNGCLPHTIFFSVGVNDLIFCNKLVKQHLENDGIVIGYGSACNSESASVLGSMRSANIPEELKNGFVRVSLSCYNTPDEIKKLVKSLAGLLNKNNKPSPF